MRDGEMGFPTTHMAIETYGDRSSLGIFTWKYDSLFWLHHGFIDYAALEGNWRGDMTVCLAS